MSRWVKARGPEKFEFRVRGDGFVGRFVGFLDLVRQDGNEYQVACFRLSDGKLIRSSVLVREIFRLCILPGEFVKVSAVDCKRSAGRPYWMFNIQVAVEDVPKGQMELPLAVDFVDEWRDDDVEDLDRDH